MYNSHNQRQIRNAFSQLDPLTLQPLNKSVRFVTTPYLDDKIGLRNIYKHFGPDVHTRLAKTHSRLDGGAMRRRDAYFDIAKAKGLEPQL